MTWVKVCGITNEEARDAAVEAGADALGFVLIEASPRFIEPEHAANLIGGSAIACYLLVDGSPQRALELAARCGAHGLQPYGDEAEPTTIAALQTGLSVLSPVPVGDEGPQLDPQGISQDAIILFDTATSDRLGGSGRAFAWEKIGQVERPFVLAGGLGPDNVGDAIRAVRPFGVDASSRLESAPGIKDPDTIRAFVREAKTA